LLYLILIIFCDYAKFGFRKKTKDLSKDAQEEENFPPSELADNKARTVSSRSFINPVAIQTSEKSSFDYGIPPHSPVSPRVKSIDQDIEALILSRQDNPFLTSKLEKLSCSGKISSSNLALDVFSNDGKGTEIFHDHSSLAMDLDDTSDNYNVHEHLIRSPPPQFPQKISHFVFPLSNSPIRNISLKNVKIMEPHCLSSFNCQENLNTSIQNKPNLMSCGMQYRNIKLNSDFNNKVDLARSGSESSLQYSNDYLAAINDGYFCNSQSSSNLNIKSPFHSPYSTKNQSFEEINLERDLNWIIDQRCESTLSSSREALISNASSIENLNN